MRILPIILPALLLALGCDAIHRRADEDDDGVRVVEVAVFEGGYGIEWHQEVVEQYNREHADEGVRVELRGDPRVADKIKPRLLRGDPPDLLMPLQLPGWLRLSAAPRLK